MSDSEIFVLRAGEQAGPFKPDELRTMVAAGNLSRRDWAWQTGLPEWRPLDQIIGFDGLPPLPTTPSESKPQGAKPDSSRGTPKQSPLTLLCGGLGLLLLLGSVFSIGGCVKAKNDLNGYWSYLNSPDGTAEVVLRSFDRGSKGDPFGQFFDMAETRRVLEAQVSKAALWAVLCMAGTGVCAIGLFLTTRRSPSLPGGKASSLKA